MGKEKKGVVRVAILGSTGKMGQAILKIMEESFDGEMSLSIEVHSGTKLDFEGLLKSDVVIDVSLPKVCESVLKQMLSHAQKQKTTGKKTTTTFNFKKLPAIVIGSTGWFKSGQDVIFNYGKYAPVLVSANFSPGITLFSKFLEEFGPKFKNLGYEVAVSEVHHHKKRDAPSGTAKMFIETLEAIEMNPQVNFIRAGSIVGQHTVNFYGQEEVFEIRHEALTRNVFARGALLAAQWLVCRRRQDVGMVGYFNMADIFFS